MVDIVKKKGSELPIENTLTGFNAIGINASNQSVQVPLDVVQNATNAANAAAGSANNAATAATFAAGTANTAAANADTKAGLADTAATAANNAASAATTAAGSANTAATAANDAATAANSAASAANTAAGNAQTVADTYVAELNERISSDELQTLYPMIPFTRRVVADSGSIRSKGVAKRLLDFCIENDLFGDTKLLICPELGIKERILGVNKYATKVYSGEFTANDAVQTTEASQPYVSGNIAPNERYSLKNLSTLKLTHPEIAVSGTYTIIKVLNDPANGKSLVSFTELTSGSLTEIAWYGILSYYHIVGSKLSASIQASISLLLSSIFPEIESVKIGDQEWATSNCEMVATSMGNVIQEMQGNNTEKAINGGFDADTDWTKEAGWTISGGLAQSDGSAGSLYQNIVTTGKWHKITFDIIATSGELYVGLTNGELTGTIPISTSGSKTIYIKSTGVLMLFKNTGTFIGSIDNVSVVELGWNGSIEIYDAVYASTAGTATEKEYAALKATAMWCHYNNDAALGAIYGKLYNGYAMKLLQKDLDMYNAENPSNHWGWHIPSFAEMTTLQTYLGGASVAGGKLKVAGTDYYNAPNTGGTNESGLSILPCGGRWDNGLFYYLNSEAYMRLIDSGTYAVILTSSSAVITVGGSYNDIIGFSLRLIKD